MVVGASVLVMLAAWGLRSVFGVFIKPMEAEFGWGRSALSTVAALSFVFNGLAGPFVGRLADRWGPRGVLAGAGVLLGVGALSAATIVSLWQLYLTVGVIVAVGAGGGRRSATPGGGHGRGELGRELMTERADVVIVGGGVTGASIAYHLVHRGVRDVLLVEKKFIASGATGRSSACVRQHYSTPETCRMVLQSLRFLETFPERTGGRSASFVRVGYLLGVDGRLREAMARAVALQQSIGIKSEVITPAEMREIEPRVRTDDFAAGCYEPEAGYADPAGTAQGLAGAAREGGARVLEDTEVLAIETAGGRVSGVRTSRGDIATPVVVNAAGIWGDRVGRMVGVDVPITVCRHKISFFSRPGEASAPHPLVYDFVQNIYTRPETGGLTLVGSLESELEDRADPDRYNEGVTFQETADAMERAVHRFPVMEHGEVAKGWAGCFDVTPDWHPILDATPVGGFYLAVGFSGNGFKLSPAVGDMMARLVVEGKTATDDVHAFRLSRFAEGKPIRGLYGDWLMC